MSRPRTLARVRRVLKALIVSWLLPLVVVPLVVQLVVYRQTSIPGLAQRPAGFPADADWLIRGDSAIVTPGGDCDYLAGPVYDQGRSCMRISI